jgi:hypothetical protein
MAAKQTSFWSTTSGVVTGVAGTLTGVVGIATMAAQLGWIGGGEDQAASVTTSTSAPGAPADGTDTTADGRNGTTAGRASRSATAPTDAEPEYSVDPSSVGFGAIGSRTTAVTVRNTGTVQLDVAHVTVEGDEPAAFAVEGEACTDAMLDPGRTCAIEVSFTPEGSGAAEGMLVIEVDGAPAEEVPLTGAALL